MPRLAVFGLLFSFLLSAVFLSAVFLSVATTPAAAQRAGAQAQAKPPSNSTALYAWCRKQVFRKYGQPDPANPKMLSLPSSRVVAMANGCVQSGGRTI